MTFVPGVAHAPLLMRLLWPYALPLASAILTRALVALSISILPILSWTSMIFQHVLQSMLLLVRTMEFVLQTPSGCGSRAALMSPPLTALCAGIEVVLRALLTRHQQLM